MLRIEQSVEIDAPVEAVYVYAIEPRHLPEYWEGVEEVKEVEYFPIGGYRFTSVTTFLGLRNEGTTEVLEFEPDERLVTETHSPLMAFTLSATFEPAGDNRTRLHSSIEYTFSPEILALRSEPELEAQLDRVVGRSLAAMKARVEAGLLVGAGR